MPLWYLIILAVLQGVTEFLPISSSGHLVLLPALSGLDDQGTFLDVAVHVGSLGAVVLYFRQDVAAAMRGTAGILGGRRGSEERLALGLFVATIPVILFGLALKLTIGTDALRSVALIGWTTLIFGLVLGAADRWGREVRRAEDWSLRHAVIFGLWQMLALIPGTSRSGIVITGGRALGYTREDAARLSMLMSIPTIIASGAVLSLDVAAEANMALFVDGALAALFAFGSALLALTLMMRLLKSVSFTPYVIYRIILGTGLLIWAYS
ncbi:undecaprenyl-diphosphate phosphatase [Jannaschia aquimarina]|uniref:Undecaprenyl-diphosphatase n=1 Tax=Jannaschia aquimarina TaxID=935700 RepID=A0A0D1EDV0_9RHOB|nr:undecaprenyl-diphosphate phosphatase [Jannaschia aquimarina]KIT15116.1 Undecaprenyl-diphosphatase [Jannaschia aquimarina]SNS64507.1 undecaprenyl-diphosphatase [Jannaschia aquimarina]